MLTRKQYELLMYIQSRLKETGVSPSFDEMKEALDLKSKSGIHQAHHRPRGTRLHPPHASSGAGARSAAPARFGGRRRQRGQRQKGFSPSVIEGSGRRNPLARPLTNSAPGASTTGPVELPVLGRIAAGTPIEALQNDGQQIAVPRELLGVGEHYALEVSGDSMVEAGIFDGDIVILQRTDSADTGDIVVALIDDLEATLKRLRRKGHSIALEAANPAYETRIFGPDRVKVQGKLVGLFRRY